MTTCILLKLIKKYVILSLWKVFYTYDADVIFLFDHQKAEILFIKSIKIAILFNYKVYGKS